MKRPAQAKQAPGPTDDRWRHVTREQFDVALREIVRDIKLRKLLEDFEQWSPPKGAIPH